MIKFLILLGVGYLLYRSVKSLMFPDGSPKKNVPGRGPGQIDDVMLKDPYCQAYFPRRDAVHLKLSGSDLYFCSEECRDQYVARQSKEN